MRTVRIRPTAAEYDGRREAYAELVAALESDGFDVDFHEPVVRRGDVWHAACEVAVYLFENADNIVATALIAAHLRKIIGAAPGAKGAAGERRAAIFDQEGAIIEEIVLDQ
jgi:hypothetical protein